MRWSFSVMDFVSTLSSLDLKEQKLKLVVLNFEDMDEEVLEELVYIQEATEEARVKGEKAPVIKVTLKAKARHKDTIEPWQRKKWFKMLTLILETEKRNEEQYSKVSAKELRAFHSMMSYQLFPTDTYNTGKILVSVPLSIRSLSQEQMRECLLELEHIYSYVDFNW